VDDYLFIYQLKKPVNILKISFRSENSLTADVMRRRTQSFVICFAVSVALPAN